MGFVCTAPMAAAEDESFVHAVLNWLRQHKRKSARKSICTGTAEVGECLGELHATARWGFNWQAFS
jgi:hypothetical protein